MQSVVSWETQVWRDNANLTFIMDLGQTTPQLSCDKQPRFSASVYILCPYLGVTNLQNI